MTKLTTYPIATITRGQSQVRGKRDPEAQNQLNQSVATHGVLQPIGLTKDGKLIWGEGRLIAAQAAGHPEIPAVVMEHPMTEGEFLTLQMVENMARSDLSPVDQWEGCVRLLEANPQWQLKDVAKALSLDPSMVTRLLSPSKCVPAVQDAFRQGKLGISDCYAISKHGEAEQLELLALKLSGASRDAIEQAGKKKRTAAPSVRLSRVKCVLPTGVQIVVSGEGISLEDVIDSLAEAGKEARKAREQGLDAKTFQAVCRDKAKAVANG